MTYLDEAALAGVRSMTRERKLSTYERLAIFAFRKKGVPVKVIAQTFAVSQNAIRYITSYEHTASNQSVKQAFEEIGEDKIWETIISPAQVESVNEGMRKLVNKEKLNDGGYRRKHRGRPRARRAGTTAELPEAAGDGENGRDSADRPVPGQEMG